jgi:spore germination protein GerM
VSRRKIVWRCLAIFGLLATTASCSIDAEGAPRDIAAGDQDDLGVNFDQAAGAATGSGRIYLLSPEVIGQSRTLQSVARDVGDNTPADALRTLFEGPNTDELQALLRSAIPPGTRLLDVSQSGRELVVNVSNELQQLTGEALIDGIAQIVLTASEITGVSAVSISIDGIPQQWPAASGELQKDPLTRYDFPGLVLSSQPAFPSVPSPGA